MKKSAMLFGAATILLGSIGGFAGTASAAPQIINDYYWGGTPTDGVDRDRVGGTRFEIDHMTVDFGATQLIVQIYSDYTNFVGEAGTELGDLFISTDGWNPFGVQPYADDDATNGEDWELVAVMDNHTGSTTSGNLAVYSVNPANIELSALFTNFRMGQETQYNPNNEPVLFTGTWNLAAGVLTYVLNFPNGFAAAGFGSTAGFHWTMTCGNDVIEGGANVPEPMTATLLGSAAALIGLRRRARKA